VSLWGVLLKYLQGQALAEALAAIVPLLCAVSVGVAFPR